MERKWLIIGGVGCLGLILLCLCIVLAVFAFNLMGESGGYGY